MQQFTKMELVFLLIIGIIILNVVYIKILGN